MKSARRVATLALLVAVVYVFQTSAQQTQRTARLSDQDEQPTGGTMRPVIRGTHAAVSSMKPEATRAAENILRAGGNAFDAAVAGQAVLALVDPASNGIGSDAEILIYDAKTRQPYSINAEAPAPKLATIEWYNKNNGGKIPTNDGLLSGSIPGTVDAWYILLDRWGTMSFEKVLEQAIDVAENGFPVPANLARSLASSKLAKYPTSVKVYQSRRYTEGELFKNSDLARTLRKLVEAEKQNASKGRHAALKAARDRFYKGDIAQTMARFSEENGGLFRYEDFANYTAKVETPVSTDYRGYRVYKNKSNTQGPAELILLNMLEGFDLKAMGHNSAEYIHTSTEALKLAFADREKFLGDMDFIKIPFEGLLSKEYAAERRKLIDPNHASLELRPGNPEKFMKGSQASLFKDPIVNLDGNASHDGDTSYIAIIDSNRNMIGFMPSLHSGWGTGVVMADLGFIFNCRGDYYSLVPGEANALAPGKRPRSTLATTLIMKDGQPYGLMGSPGADDQLMRTVQTLLNIVDFDMNVQQAIEAPRWSTRSFPASPFPHTMYPGDLGVESRIGEKVQQALIAKGHKLRVSGPWSMSEMAVIVIDPKTGVLHAGADPRNDAYAWAW
ncbi:MAG TPA: gamma-glutamyltransferase [Terriglobia bacterium]|nr:gamma-glutamyltransferase [Terriglobia bacterium]